MQITIAHLLPDLLNLYGDRGNVLCMKNRLIWRGIEAEIVEHPMVESFSLSDVDIVFLGGGSDAEQKIAALRLSEYEKEFREYVESDGVLLAICGGLQLIGEYYQSDDESIKGLSLVDAYTKSGDKRLVGNIVIESELPGITGSFVGFENHGGRTYIGSHAPLGRVINGYGNNGDDKFEGLVYKNIIGTYLHGPVLPKNPILADYILTKALERKYRTPIILPQLDDTAETRSHDYLINRFR
ncbi:MAG: glutamine amidotransferase [Oscillospiraceae bacterium]|nr:glutamine amidotransferase [Oscillospiraceae bacterium]